MALKLSKKKGSAQQIVKKVQPSKKLIKKKPVVESEVNLPTGEYIEGVGRRKVATARVRIYPKGSGEFFTNNLPASQYFANILHSETKLYQPLDITANRGSMSVSAQVSGSGIAAQLDAVILGLCRALVKLNPENKTLLKKENLLTRDDRMKETRKIGMGGKARRKRQSPKR